MWIAIIDATGKTRARSVCLIIPRQVKQDEVVPFDLKLPVRVKSGMLLTFAY